VATMNVDNLLRSRSGDADSNCSRAGAGIDIGLRGHRVDLLGHERELKTEDHTVAAFTSYAALISGSVDTPLCGTLLGADP
jgi:hypothetical protein